MFRCSFRRTLNAFGNISSHSDKPRTRIRFSSRSLLAHLSCLPHRLLLILLISLHYLIPLPDSFLFLASRFPIRTISLISITHFCLLLQCWLDHFSPLLALENCFHLLHITPLCYTHTLHLCFKHRWLMRHNTINIDLDTSQRKGIALLLQLQCIVNYCRISMLNNRVFSHRICTCILSHSANLLLFHSSYPYRCGLL